MPVDREWDTVTDGAVPAEVTRPGVTNWKHWRITRTNGDYYAIKDLDTGAIHDQVLAFPTQAYLDALTAAKKFAEENYHVATYQSKLLKKEEWFETDNGDGTYSTKAREIAYTYTGKNLTQHVEKWFYTDGTEVRSETVNYFYDPAAGKVIRKKV